jgi:hypothetical protein
MYSRFMKWRKWSTLQNFLKRLGKFRALNSKRILILVLVSPLIAAFVSLIVTAPIFSSSEQSSESVPYATQNIKDPSLELKQTKQKQAGVSGKKIITYKVSKSLFNIIFGGQTNQTFVSSREVNPPVPKIVASGTLRYQYMYCSNGSYRYYTDTQFKNPDIGFTHKSPDSCAQNHDGTETQLANAAPRSGSKALVTSFTPISIPNCATTSIPYGIDREDVSWLPVGQTETYPGLNGTFFSCLGTTVQPINEVIYTGTGTDYNALAQEEAQALARQKCTNEYNSAVAQVSAGGGGGSIYIELQKMYEQCLDAAS